MSEQLKHLLELEAQLHEVNRAFAAASRPLERLSEMNLQEREQVAAGLRAAQARWEQLSGEIAELLRTPAQAAIESMGAKDGLR